MGVFYDSYKYTHHTKIYSCLTLTFALCLPSNYTKDYFDRNDKIPDFAEWYASDNGGRDARSVW